MGFGTKKAVKACVLMGALSLPLACGPGDTAANDEYLDAAPDTSTIALDEEGANAVAQGLGSAADGGQNLQNECHPHLFVRTHEVVGLLNHVTRAIFTRIEAVADRHPKAQTGASKTWERIVGNDMVKLTLTKSDTNQVTFELDVKARAAADSAYVSVATGTLTKTDGAPHTGAGTMHLDLTALAGVNPAEKTVGVIDVTLDVSAATKKLVFQVAGFDPNTGDVRPPRDGKYVYQRTRDVGGSLKFQQDVVLFCPKNVNLQTAHMETVTRWAKLQGEWSGRSDSMAVGGQIATGDTWLGTTCFQPDAPADTAERYWQMKLEDANGQVLQGQATDVVVDASHAPSTCNPTFGALPSITSNQGDYDFASINFTDDSVVPYPGKP